MSAAIDTCVHCRGLRGEFVGHGDGTVFDGGCHVCADRRRWTQAERDAFRVQARRRDPRAAFAPSTERIAELFGGRSAR
jgi:hypothetical protein